MTLKGSLVLVGGFLVHLTLGTGFTFGNMSPYLTSYLHIKVGQSNVSSTDAVWGYAMTVFGQGALMTVGGLLNNKIGPRLTTVIGCIIASTGVAVTYYTINDSLGAMVATYGLMFGVGIGIAYVPALATGMRWFPKNKGLVNGIVVGGFGLGAFVFAQVQTAYLNPRNRHPNDQGYFTDPLVLERVPNVFLLLSSVYAALQLIGCILLFSHDIDDKESIPLVDTSKPAMIASSDHCVSTSSLADSTYGSVTEPEEDSNPKQLEEYEKELPPKVTKEPELAVLPCYTPKEMLKCKQFYILWFTFFLNNQIVTYINSMYKAYGQTFIRDDQFLATVGAVAAVFNSSGRVLWGWVMDKSSYKICMIVLTIGVSILLATLGLTPYGGKVMFAIWIWAIYFTFSGTYALLPTCTTDTFGITHAGVNYGLVFSNTVLSSPIAAVLTQTLSKHLGWYGIFAMLACFSFASFGVTLLFKELKPTTLKTKS